MTGSVSLFFPLMISALVLAVLALVFGMMLSWRKLQERADTHTRALMDSMDSRLTLHNAQLETLLEQHARSRQSAEEQMNQNVETIRADLEWLAGEKMIEEAMQLVRDNTPLTQISQETGLSKDTIRTLAAFRPH